MKLYGTKKSRSFRCVWAAEEAGLDYEYIEVALGSSELNGSQTDNYRQLNFQGKVPTYCDNHVTLTESGAILSYFAKIHPEKSLIPNDTSPSRAHYDQLAFFVMSDLEQSLWTNSKHRFALPAIYRVPDVLPITHWEFEKSQKALVRLIGEHPAKFALGENFTMVDILIAHTLNWAESFKFKVLPGLLDYKTRLYSRPACIAALEKIEI
ncbi:MAG: glutathione S-transferase [Oleiphilaceae bacterium]|jgi:glutathione S-transferase